MRRYAIAPIVIALLLSMLMPGATRASHEIGPDVIYFAETGHTLRAGFLDYWRHEGALPVFGYPLTEELPIDGTVVQYFERAVFEWHPDAPPEWRVTLQRLGAIAAAPHQQTAPFQPTDPQSNRVSSFFPESGFFPQTGHRIDSVFRDFWETNGAIQNFGYPLSEAFDEDGLTVQYFERAVFEWHPEAPRGWTVKLRRLGAVAADRDGVDQTPIAQPEDVPAYDPGLWRTVVDAQFAPSGVTTPLAGAPAEQPQWIEVDLARQYVRAWEYDQLVFETRTSTGTARTPTPPGLFSIYYKVPVQDMSGGRAGTPGYY